MTKKPNGHDRSEESAIDFPCDFVIKVIGKARDDFDKVVISIFESHFANLDHSRIQKKFSKDKNYISLSVTVYAETKPQLDAIYQALSSCKLVLMAL